MSLVEISYPRQTQGHMRFRDPYGETYARALEGLAEFDHTINDKGSLVVNTDIEYENEWDEGGKHFCSIAHLSLCGCEGVHIPAGSERIITDAPEYWRLCYRRAQQDFRFRSEYVSGKLIYTPTYHGVGRFHWYDRTPHLYHVGPGYLAPDGSIWMIPAPASIAPQPPENVLRAMAKKESEIFRHRKELVNA